MSNLELLTLNYPANTTATLLLPTGDPASLREGEKSLDNDLGVVLKSVENGLAVIDVASGAYEFTSQLNASPTK